MVKECKAVQNHHDYYVGKMRRRKLAPEEIYNLELARIREKAGLAKPLEGGSLDPVLFFFSTLRLKIGRLIYGEEKYLPKLEDAEGRTRNE